MENSRFEKEGQSCSRLVESSYHAKLTKEAAAMSEKIIHLNEAAIKSELKELVRSSVEETLNELLEQEAQVLTNAGQYERTENRQGYRSGHYE